MKKIIIGITGASGVVIARKIIEFLNSHDNVIYIVISKNGEIVFEKETGQRFDEYIRNIKNVTVVDNSVMDSFLASGSNDIDGMVVVPCSMSSLGKLAGGITDNLIIRAADVMIKENRKLILVPRETPLNSIHLENMLKLSRLNVVIFPPMPAFYSGLRDIDDMADQMAGRIIKLLGIKNNLYRKY